MVMATVLPAGIHTVEAATFAMTEAEAVELLRTYNIVRGNPGGQLDLDQPITRAQAATVFVRVMGYEELAQALREVVPFSDAKGHWAAGEIAMAERLGLMRGDGDGTFRPQANITYAEVLTVLLRIVKAEPEGPWNPNNIFSAADRFGFAPRGVSATSPALRGKIFWALTGAITQVKLPTGETVMQKHLDQTPPTLVLDKTSVDTAESTVVITGTTRDAVMVYVGNQPASLDSATGRFVFTTNLSVGSNAFTVEARDVAGNKATAQFNAQRKAPIISLEIEGPTVLQANTATRLTVKAKNSQGSYVSLEGLQATLSGDVATFDLATTTLRTGSRAGRGVLTLSAGSARQSFVFDVTAMSTQATKLGIASVNNGVAPAVGKEFTVKVQVIDNNGRLLTDDFGRTIRLTATGGNGITITPASVNSQAGIATFTVKGTTEGTATLVATSSGLEEDSTVVQLLTSTRVVLTATPTPLKPDGISSARFTAYLQDENGRAVTNTSVEDIRVTLSSTGPDTYFSDPYLTIRRGYNNSESDYAYLKAGVLTGTAAITGRITSDHTYTVQPLQLPLTGTPAPVKLQLVTPAANRFTPGAAPMDITLQVLDANNRVVTWGSFGFRLRVTTSNNEPAVNGLPEGVTLTYPDLNYGPSYDGSNRAVPGRTNQGTATLKLAYNKSGTVTITPELIGAADEAYNSAIGLGPASATTGLASVGAQFLFAGTPSAVQLTVDSNLGRDKPAGAVSTGTSMTVKARVIDANGAPIPGYNGNVTLTRSTGGNLVTRLVGTNGDSMTRSTTNGYTEFSLQANNAAGFDVYTATTGNLPAANITVAVRKEKPVTPSIVAIRGVKEGDPSPVVGYVAPDDNYMDIQLAIQDPPNAGEPTYWVTARVTRKGESTPVISDVMVNLASSLPVIRIPKANLRAGKDIYQVSIHDGFGNSDLSPDLGLSEAVNSVYNSNYRLTAAYYDAASTKLTLITNNLATNGIISKDLLTIVKDNNRLNLGDERVTVVSVNPGAAVLQLNGLASSFNPDVFNGNVTLQAQDGWYKSNDSIQVARGGSAVVLRPAAMISSGMLDKGSKTLYLNGMGFTHGTLALDLIKVGSVALRPGSTTSHDRLTSTTDNRLTVVLSQATFDAIEALTGPDIAIGASTGWLKTSYGGAVHQAPELAGTNRPLQMAVTVNSASYDRSTNTLTISGQGFNGATLDPTKLVFRRTTTRTTYQFSAPAVATVVDDNTITVVLGEADATFFESTTDGGFSGQQVFLNTSEGWLKDAQQRQAAPIATDRVLFAVPAR